MSKVFHAELWGTRRAKYDALNAVDIENTQWQEIKPQGLFYLFKPQNIEMLDEYQKGWKITDTIPANTVGVVTRQDAKTIAFSPEAAEELANGHGLDRNVIRPILYRPFDDRFIVYDGSVVTRPRLQVMRHMLEGDNLALISARSNKSPSADHFFCGKTIMETKCGERTTQSALFPVYLYSDPSHPAGRIDEYWPAGKGGRRPNLNPDFVKEMEEKLGLKFVSDGTGDLKKTFGPEDVFHCMYAVFHSPTYRNRYAEFLKIDFPRLPQSSPKSFTSEVS
ncbi:MAG TPA: hypothetical protein ENH84_00660, partial [Phycisphaerae bacterium]|nr:hypothetical protein [Phycisphaerae bacterium]